MRTEFSKLALEGNRMYIQDVIQQQNIKLVIFDLDGTLVDSVPEIALAVDDALVELNLPKAGEDRVRLWVGNGLKKLWERALSFADAYSPEYLEETYDGLLVHYANHVNQTTCLYDGVVELLSTLKKQKIKTAICTNKMEKFVPGILESQGIDTYIDLIVGGDTLHDKKPSAVPLLHICSSLHVENNQTLMIGDSPADAGAANEANIPVVLLEQGYNQGVDLRSLSAFSVKKNIQALL